MPEPFKENFNAAEIAWLAGHLARVQPGFDRDRFVADATAGLDDLELKQRSAAIRRALEAHLPGDFPAAVATLRAALRPPDSDDRAAGVAGWMILPIADYVALNGAAHVDLTLAALKEMTSRFSAEFAIRHLLLRAPEATLAALAGWVRDPDVHVRRLVSEGTRPRLPWGRRLAAFQADPAPLLPLLTALRDDPEDTVRRSVANSLNDIAKDHPDLVVDLARGWLRDAPEPRRRLVRHALRSLIKAGHAGALDALGYGAGEVAVEDFRIATPTVDFGAALGFEVALRSTAAAAQELVLDYVIHHRKANGRTAPKVFKWKTLTLAAGAAHRAARRHPIRQITTRRYHPGEHHVELMVNGRAVARGSFQLRIPNARRGAG